MAALRALSLLRKARVAAAAPLGLLESRRCRLRSGGRAAWLGRLPDGSVALDDTGDGGITVEVARHHSAMIRRVSASEV
ncbi:hypothetical protein MRX96_037227 [Rhipicephalus microplus]